jgi:hypothetical protein
VIFFIISIAAFAHVLSNVVVSSHYNTPKIYEKNATKDSVAQPRKITTKGPSSCSAILIFSNII